MNSTDGRASTVNRNTVLCQKTNVDFQMLANKQFFENSTKHANLQNGLLFVVSLSSICGGSRDQGQ